MKKVLIAVIVFGFLISCQKKEDNFTKDMINKLIITENGVPPYYSSFDLYISTNNNHIVKTNNNELNVLYKRYYFKKFKTVQDYLEEVLNKNYVINQSSLNNISLESFQLNQEIEKQYSEIGFDHFLKIYSKKNDWKNSKLQLNRSIIKDDQYQTIVYILYKNKYDIASDCYIGIDYIVKRKDSFK